MKNSVLFMLSVLALLLLTNTVYSQSFRTTWITTDSTITIPTNDSLDYDYEISWKNLTNKGIGDGSAQEVKGNYTIQNLENGSIYEVAITGDFPHFYMNEDYIQGPYKGEAQKLKTIEEWGIIEWLSMNSAFEGCTYLTYTATDIPNLEKVKDMSFMFDDCENFKGNSSIDQWNTSNVTDMSNMFSSARIFNQPIGKWNTANVTTMSRMFLGAEFFNYPIGEWNTEKVTTMSKMFYGAMSFDQPIREWNTENVTDMSDMFYYAISFNQSIEKWNIQNVTDMSAMFNSTKKFNQPIGKWNTSNVKNMEDMFDHVENGIQRM